MKILIHEGELVTCPECDERLAVMRRDIRTTESLTWNAFAFTNDEYRHRTHLKCWRCEAEWMKVSGRVIEIHLSRGWTNIYPADFLC